MISSRVQKSKVNFAVAAVCQLVTTLLSFVTRGLFVNVLSTNYLGISGLFTSVLTILSLAELGIGNAMVYSLYRPIHDKDTYMISYYMNLFKKAYIIIVIGVVILGFAIIPFLHYFVKSPEGVTESIYTIYLFFLANSAISYLLAYKRSIIYADQKSYVITASTTVTHILQLAFQYIILLYTKNYLLYLAIQIIMTLVTNAIVSIYVNKNYEIGKIRFTKYDRREEREKFLKNLKSLSISKIAGVVNSSADNIITTQIISLTAVGYASNYYLVINAISHFVSNTMSGLTGSIGNLNADNDIKNREKVFNELFVATYAVYYIICSSIFALINPLIYWWLGPQYIFSNYVVAAIVLNIYIAGINYPSYVFRTTSGYFKEATKFYVASAILNIALSVLFGKLWGLAGIYVATSVARLMTSEISDGYYGVKYGACSKPKTYFIKYYLFLFLIIANSVLNYFLVSRIPIGGFCGLIIKSVTSVIFCTTTCLLIIGFTKSFRSLIERFINKKRRE